MAFKPLDGSMGVFVQSIFWSKKKGTFDKIKGQVGRKFRWPSLLFATIPLFFTSWIISFAVCSIRTDSASGGRWIHDVQAVLRYTLWFVTCRERKRRGREACGTETQCPAVIICLGSYRAYLRCWQSHTQADMGKGEDVGTAWGASRVFWLLLIASEEIKSEM